MADAPTRRQPGRSHHHARREAEVAGHILFTEVVSFPPGRVEPGEEFDWELRITNTGLSDVTFDHLTTLAGGSLPSRELLDRIEDVVVRSAEVVTVNPIIPGSETEQIEPGDYRLESVASFDGDLHLLLDIPITVEPVAGGDGDGDLVLRDTAVLAILSAGVGGGVLGAAIS